jgi:hypothetical protein
VHRILSHDAVYLVAQCQYNTRILYNKQTHCSKLKNETHLLTRRVATLTKALSNERADHRHTTVGVNHASTSTSSYKALIRKDKPTLGSVTHVSSTRLALHSLTLSSFVPYLPFSTRRRWRAVRQDDASPFSSCSAA